jgi:thiol-disulfide isomerase/thioredoxin
LATACLLGLAQASYADDEKAQAQPTLAEARRVAPNFVGISNWLNSDPLSITDLRGKVVLVDFWTYGCINCVNTLPHVTKLYDTYQDKGLVVIGVHTPHSKR